MTQGALPSPRIRRTARPSERASLRNVALTYPYFHDGSAATLEEAVSVMGREMLGKELDDATITQLVAFLGSLTGDQPTVTVPALP